MMVAVTVRLGEFILAHAAIAVSVELAEKRVGTLRIDTGCT